MTYLKLPLNPPTPLQTESSAASTLEELLDWRVRDRVRTVAAGLVLCLHLGVDPPDVWKPSPCARWECWVDPITGNPIRKVGTDAIPQEESDQLTLHLKSNSQAASNSNNSTEKIRESIARNLLLQYENWQPRVRYKTLLDPTCDDLRKLCTSLRKSARSERVLIHYNGHGVPRPTRNGELWVFNKQFTQYIPVNISDVVSWTGWPAVWILDCPAAAFLAHTLQKVVTSLTAESLHDSSSNNANGTIFSFPTTINSTNTNTSTTNNNTSTEAASDPLKLIVFSACDSHETLPFTPSFPADILTSCLTTPLDMAIRWHCYIGGPLLPKSLSVDSALQIPGKISDRRTPLGELNWIFTAITDTIAWLVLPRDLFRRLYRQDLLIASLSRNYLLAQRILKSLYCTASTYPPLPSTHQHNLWTLWDHAIDTLLAQMSEPPANIAYNGTVSPYGKNPVNSANINANSNVPLHGHISQSTFFPDQLDAFELWLLQHKNIPPNQISGPPDQLPAALQVLLSQNLRPRALKLFAEFCDFGPWACLECLHVGIHPYILKLIVSNNTTPASNIVTKSLLQIWTRLMSVDPTCKTDLLKDSAFVYFVNAFLVETKLAAMAIVAFSLDNQAGRDALLNNETFFNILRSFSISSDDGEEEIICKLLLLNQFPGISNFDPSPFLLHDCPEIRAAAILAVEYTVVSKNNNEAIQFVDVNVQDVVHNELSQSDDKASIISNLNSQSSILNDYSVINAANDPSPIVRLEVLNKTREDLNCWLNDPFDAISKRFKEGNFKSNFAANFINGDHKIFDNFNNINTFKCKILNQLEIDAWLEHENKLEIQLAVLESPQIITKIFFHQSQTFIYFLDIDGILRRWDWQDDPDTNFNELESIDIGASDAILLENWIYSIDQFNGAIRIYSLDKKIQSAFNCGDNNPKLLQCKNGNILIIGDKKISLYNPITQKLSSNNRMSMSLGSVRDLIEIDSGFVIATDQGTLELYGHNLESLKSYPLSKNDIISVYFVNGLVHVITSDSNLYLFDPISCESTSTYHFNPTAIGVTCFSPHPLIPHLLAYGTTDQSIKICSVAPAVTGTSTVEFNKLQSIRYHDGFLGQRLGSINKLAWHPKRIILGTVTSESFISIYGMNKQE